MKCGTRRPRIRRCRAQKCPNPAVHFVYCHQHWPALGEELRARLKAAVGTADWVPAIAACDARLETVREWVKNNVTGGSNADSDKARG